MRNKDKVILADPFLNKCHGKSKLPGDALFACAYDLNMGVDIFEEAVFFRRTAETDELWILEDDDLETVKEIAARSAPGAAAPPLPCHCEKPASAGDEAISTTSHHPRAMSHQLSATSQEPPSGPPLPCHCEEPASGGRRSNLRHSPSAMNYELSAISPYAGCAYIVPRSGSIDQSCEALLGRLFFSRVGCYWPEGFLLPGIIGEPTYYRVKAEVDREVDENVRRAEQAETEIIRVARQLGLSPRPTGIDHRFWYANCPGKGHPLEIKAEANLFFCGYCGRKGSIEELRMLVKERKGG